MRTVASQPISDTLLPRKQQSVVTQTASAWPSYFHNASVNQSLVQRKSDCACGGGCPRCSEEIQPKLNISSPGDVYEQEADRIAEKVMRIPTPSTHGQTKSDLAIQRIPNTTAVTSQAASNFQLSQSNGRPLSSSMRQFMEPRFGVDFSHVRVHTDDDAHESASQINARAFTVGHNIWLGRKESDDDKGLMAHELTHVVQQSGNRSGIAPQLIQRTTLVGRENECVALEDRELNVGEGTPLAETTTPGGRVIPGTRGSSQNCAGASLCGRQEYINWPFLGLQAADGVVRPGMTADWDAANYFVPRGCVGISCSGISLNASRCSPTEREVILFLYRWPAGVVRGTSTIVYQSDFHMIGRTPSTLPMAWESKMDQRERVEDIRDPWQSLYDAYPHTRGRDREIRQHCFCCDCEDIRTRA
jgi:hypothetical protein